MWTLRRAAAVLLLLVGASLLMAAAARQDGDGDQLSSSPSLAAAVRSSATPPARLADGEMWMRQMDLMASGVVTRDARLEDVEMDAQDVLLDADGLHAGTLSVVALVPFDVVAEEVGPDAEIAAAGQQAKITRIVEILGRDVRVAATGTVKADRGQVLLEPTSINIGAPGWVERRMGDVARELVTIRHDVEGLPESLVLRKVSVERDGFRVTLSGEDVRLGG